MIPKTYVVPLDGSPFAERAVPIAGALAQRVGGKLVLVSATSGGPLEPRTYLSEVAARYPDLSVETLVHDDDAPVDAILKVVGDSDDRILCMTSHGRGRLRWAILGSTAEDVVRRSDRPMLLVGRHCRDDFLTPDARMLACVDGTDDGDRFAPVVLEWAAQLGLSTDAAVVVNPRDVESAEHPETLIDPIVEHFGGPDQVRAHLLTSAYVAGALADLAVDLPAAMIAMSCSGRSGLTRVVLGSVTMAVLHLALCPLLVTRCAP